MKTDSEGAIRRECFRGRMLNAAGRFLIVTFLAGLVAPPTIRAQETYYISNGTGLQAVRDDPRRATCNHWEVWLLKTDGNAANPSSRWGVIWGKSAEKVTKELKWDQNFEVRFNKWINSPNLHDYPDTHFNPVGPICVTDTAFEAKPGVLQTLDKLGSLGSRMSTVLSVIERLQQRDPLEQDIGLSESNPGQPYSYLGTNFRQYLSQISMAMKQISKIYDGETRLLGPSVQEINLELKQANQAVTQAENNVSQITAVLSRANPPTRGGNSSPGAWTGQRVEVNGAQIIQDITISKDQVTVSQGDAGTSMGQTYTVPKADLSASTTSLRHQGSAWILTVVMPHRSAKLHMSGGAGQDEIVSRLELFFASEGQAHAAAQNLTEGIGH